MAMEKNVNASYTCCVPFFLLFSILLFLVFLFPFVGILSSSLRCPRRNSTLLYTSVSSFVSICLDTHVHMPFAVVYNGRFTEFCVMSKIRDTVKSTYDLK